jgi:hypothetical protein
MKKYKFTFFIFIGDSTNLFFLLNQIILSVLEDVVRVPVSEFTALTQSIQSMNNKLDSLTPSLLPVRTVLSPPPATSISSQPMNGGGPRGPLSAATAGYSRTELPELPPRIPERKTPGQPLPATRDRPPDPGIVSAHTSDKDSLLDDTKTRPLVSSVVVTSSTSSTVSVTTSAVKNRGGPIIDGEVKKQVLNVTEVASFSTPSGAIGKGGKREEEGKMEEELTSSLEISSEAADQQAKVIHREKIQKTKSQELRDFTQEFVATSTIDFDPMSFQDHQTARNKNDTLRRRLMQETVGTPATVNQLGTPAASKQLGTPVTSKLSGTPLLPRQLGTPVAPTQSITPAVPVPASQPSVKTTTAPVLVISTAEKKAHASKDDLHSPVEKNREGVVHRERIVPSESFMTALQQSGSESSQDEPPPPPEVAKRDKADQPPADDSTVVPVENRGSSTLTASPGGPVPNSGGPVRAQPGSVGLSASSGPVRQDLHTTAGAGTSSDLLEWAKGILAAYPGLKVRLVMDRTSLNRLMLATKCYLSLMLATKCYLSSVRTGTGTGRWKVH